MASSFGILWISSFLSCSSQFSDNARNIFFDDTYDATFLHLVVNTVSGKVYIGATNRLYQLTEFLQPEVSLITGPSYDNPLCPPPMSECHCLGSNCKEFEKSLMTNLNKFLVVDYRGERLIACTNLFQGHCSRHLTSNITLIDPPVWSMTVPNDEISSVVMFVGPGPPNPASTNVLYIASTRSTLGLPAYKDIVPAISMRNLHDLDLVSDDILTPSRIDIEVQQRDLFRVHYVYGFGSLGFSYFLTVQKVAAITDSEKYVTQISRICQNDKSLYSYTELPLECHSLGVHYNLLRSAYVTHPGARLAKSLGLPHIAPLTDLEHVLVAVFSHQNQSQYASDQSALCIYTLRDVRQKFTETIQRCFHGIGNTGPDHFVQPKPCFKTPFEIGDDYCGQHDINHPMKGTDPVSREALAVWNSTNVTAVTVTTTDESTIAFVGTENGFIKKVVIDSGGEGREYESIPVEPGIRINQDLTFDRPREHLYVLTPKKVFRVRVQDCHRYASCTDCLSSKDPYCGWCPVQRRCGTKSECKRGVGWLSYAVGQCPRLLKVIPLHAQKQLAATSMVILTVQHLPASSSGYQCIFTGHGVTRSTPVISVDNLDGGISALKCETPISNLLPPFPTGKDHIVMRLSIATDAYEILSADFTFFDCAAHAMCTKCTGSDFPCIWCVQRHRCTSSQLECQTDVLIAADQAQTQSELVGSEFCPRFENVVANSTEILVSSSTELNVRVKAFNLQSFQASFKCIFSVNGGVERSAWLVTGEESAEGTLLDCDRLLFQYPGDVQYINVPFTVVWGSVTRKALDNPLNIQVRVFKCSKMAYNCGRCRAVENQYECGWCVATKSCTIRNQCKSSVWLSRGHTCPDPVITRIIPQSGPLDGGTDLTVFGENLGLSRNDSAVSVDGLPCAVTRCEPSVKVVCQTGRRDSVNSGPVIVTIGGSFTAKSSQTFSYVMVQMSDFRPIRGPVSGGSTVTVSGYHLDAGSETQLVLANETMNVVCDVISRSFYSVVCLTASVSQPFLADVLNLTVDNSVVILKGHTFSFAPDPVIESIFPERGIFSGGMAMTVRGRWLDSISNPIVVLYYANLNATGPCTVVTSEQMVCVSPGLRQSSVTVSMETWEEPMILSYGFLLDGVQSTRNLTGHSFLLYPDPEFEEFENKVKRFFSARNEYLTINGRQLNRGLGESDIQVKISGTDCEVTSLSSTQLTCLPSDNMTAVPAIARVTVLVGTNVSYYIGNLRIDQPDAIVVGAFSFSFAFMMSFAAGAGFLLTVICVVCVAYHRKSKESTRVLRRMQSQMDILEARVAKECKEAFAELQTDMTVVSGNLTGNSTIPFRNYSSFCVHVLFPGIPGNDHPVLSPFEYSSLRCCGLDHSLGLFKQLIGNKVFLLLFIRTLEQHKEVIVREKVNVASLLSIALHDRLDYQTDILKTLLAELIEQVLESGQHPKLLFRRTESIAEKMLTNWFTFLLHKFLKECVGEPLYMLCRAIKHQVDRGPVDALTGESKYSLSEEKLIRQQLEYRVITVHVTDKDDQYTLQPCTVKVLDCDTISQVKDKILDSIYKYVPFSLRPDKDDLDLEWETDVKGHLLLQDEDSSTNHSGELRHLNTLSHYDVDDGAVLSLVPKRRSPYNLISMCDQVAFSNKYDTLFASSLPLSQSMSHHGIGSTTSAKVKYYHLVKEVGTDHQPEGERSKMVSEIFLTRLLATKGTLQQFIDNLFETIFSTCNHGCVLPLAIKYLFDFLDDQALCHGITDPQVVHTWKSNSLPLRFWVNIITNYDFVFDISKSSVVDSCLSVIAQTFMDSCSVSDQKLGKDSPSSKLLFAKDIPKYKKWVGRYYEDIQCMPPISEQDMNFVLREESTLHQNEFNTSAALYELYQFTLKYHDDLMQSLEEDEFARNYRLADRLNRIHISMDYDSL